MASPIQAYETSGDPAHLIPCVLSLWQEGRFLEAYKITEKAPPTFFSNPEFLIVRGMVARYCDGLSSIAIDSYERAISLDPTRADAYYNLANLYADTNISAAVPLYLQSLALNSTDSKSWHNLGIVLNKLKEYNASASCLRQAVKLAPDNCEIYCNLGLAHQGTQHFELAKRSFLTAISTDQTHAASYINLGNALVDLRSPVQALDYLQRGVALSGGAANSVWNLSLVYLLLGEYQLGWALYESRFLTESFSNSPAPSSGDPIQDIAQLKTDPEQPYVVWSEQGLGDSIQFGRYLSLLKHLSIPFVLLTREPLAQLFVDWFHISDVQVLQKGMNQIFSAPHIPLMSLPRLFSTTLDTIPSATPYISSSSPIPPSLQLPSSPGGLSVGIAWAANPDNKSMYEVKSIPLADLIRPLVKLVDLDLIDLHSLQYGNDLDQIDSNPHLVMRQWHHEIKNLSDTAFIVSQLDLVITVDTALAHLSGALGKPTWLLLPYNADFRWLYEGSSSPWYPSMTLFRQTAQGDWSSPIEQIQSHFETLLQINYTKL